MGCRSCHAHSVVQESVMANIHEIQDGCMTGTPELNGKLITRYASCEPLFHIDGHAWGECGWGLECRVTEAASQRANAVNQRPPRPNPTAGMRRSQAQSEAPG